MYKYTSEIVPEIMTTLRVLGELESSEQMTHSQRNKVNSVRQMLLEKLTTVFKENTRNADTLLMNYRENGHSEDAPF